MSSDVLLDIDSLRKAFGGAVALDSVSLQIPAGEIFALLGPNGAGKTTLIGCVCGLVRKTSGRIRLFGLDLDEDGIRPRYDVGLVPQEINFDPFFTVEEALQIQLGYYGRQRDDARIAEVLAALNLTAKAKAATRALSGGMKRRLLIAKALVHRPKLLFLDEPTAGVDVELRRDLWTYVCKLRAEGMTIVLTTHYLEEAEELADRIGVINEGKLLLVENKTALMDRLGERRLEVRFSSAVADLPEAAEQAGAQLSPDGTRAVYLERPGARPAGEVLKALYAASLPITEVETRRSRLEEVMLRVLREQRLGPAA
jgi:ABC-2 type transport system ATP-binding protein